MGGFGAFDLAMAYPDRFAAVVPVEESERVVEVLEACDANVKFTVYPENGHDVCSLAYQHKELFSWLLEQKKG